MARGKKMTPAQRASARWKDVEPAIQDTDESSREEEPANGDHFVISLALIGIVAIVAIVFTTMQGGAPF